jgi:hypothetical protein
MNKIVTLVAVLLIGPIVGAPVALAQTTTAPNSGAGVSGLPENESGPAGQQFIIIPGQSNVPGPLGSKSGPAVQSTTGLEDRAQSNEQEDEEDQGGFSHQRPGTMGMPERVGHHREHSMVGLRIIFSLMDADGDGTVSLQEWQAAQERVFKAMDTDHDGTVTLGEMQAFFQGR